MGDVGEVGDALWEPFGIVQVQELLAGYRGVWWLSGGHALDVFLGRATRPHGDIDVGVPRDDVDRLREHVCPRLELVTAAHGRLRPFDQGHLDANVHGLWGRETSGGPWRVQINLEPVTRDEWTYRRDERVHRPWREVVWRAGDLPYRNPAVGLLWKARDPTATDELDYANVEPRLPSSERSWLAHAVAVAHPDSPWIARLKG